MERYNILDWAGWALASIGALNWGLVGASDFNLVRTILGRYPMVERAVYIVVGLAGVVSLYRFVSFLQTPREMREVLTAAARRAA